VSAIARAAGVDRSFLYRHRDLLEKIHALAAEPPTASERAGPAVTHASLQADLLAARERAARLHSRVEHLERRLSDALGEPAWREFGLGAPADIDALHQKITHLEQQVIDLAPTTAGARRGPRRRPRHPTASSWPASTWPCPPGRLTPARVRRGFRRLRAKITLPAHAPKPSRPGPGRPPGVPNQHRAPRHDVGKINTRADTKTVKQPMKG
jgi:BMFP domain-containing protein YqiC